MEGGEIAWFRDRAEFCTGAVKNHGLFSWRFKNIYMAELCRVNQKHAIYYFSYLQRR
jgi:hypothetical protein